MALMGKKVDFSKVIGMVDKMVTQLGVEQADDDHKKEYCSMQFDMTDDKKKGLEHSISDLESSIATEQEAIATLKDEIKALEKGIKALDKSVAEATEQRKEENEDFTGLMASDSAAKSLLEFAKNRLNKFYNPKLYKEPAAAAAMAQVNLHSQREAPPPPPATAGAFKKKGEESNGVIAMMDLLVADLDKEMTVATQEEKDAQADYETMLSDSASKRAEDMKSLSDKGAAKADAEAALQGHTDDHTQASKEHMATVNVIAATHAECDFLMQNFDMRKEARNGEIDSLKKAKAVLSGADYSLLQVSHVSHLRGRN
jgi:septal ring factor EnvC (AmiA/AmiB activator)